MNALAEMRESELSAPHFRAVLFGGFAAISVVLALIGLYGSLSQMIVRRTHEVSIRMALGASRRHILGSILRYAFWVMLQGMFAGVVIGGIGLRFVGGFIYGVDAGGAMEFAAAAIILWALTAAVGFWPASRAASIDPIYALRND